MRKEAEILRNASQSCRLLNSAILTPDRKPKNTVQGILGAGKGNLNDHETTNISQISDSEPQHHQAPALDGADAGKEKSLPRIRIRFVGHRVRPLDPDNFAGSCKDLLDGCRHAGLIRGDEPWRIIFETAQEKVKSYAEERTLIEIEPVSERGKGLVTPIKPKEVLAPEQTTVECKDE